ncbi:SurE domain-containing protein [Mycena kentingensis (nom. inval.)]|nr:SurE domain-containing protein [Mycena kentingensis (nom. inval.)]
MFPLVALALLVGSTLAAPSANKLVLTNDDGWATAQIRAQFQALNAAGYNTILSAPAENQSGTGSFSRTPTNLTSPCEFNSCPSGSNATGHDATNLKINYVNAYPVDSALFGINTLSPQFFGAKPDLVVSGPNVGSNLALAAFFSGTMYAFRLLLLPKADNSASGAASAAANAGIPSVAFSGASGSQVSFTTLTSDPNSASSQAARIYSQLTVKFLDVLLASPAPILPAGVSLNVNFPEVEGSCTTVDSFRFVLTRLLWNFLPIDVETCGTKVLPDESSVVGEDGACQVSVSVFNPATKLDVGASTQEIVLNKLSSILSCAV